MVNLYSLDKYRNKSPAILNLYGNYGDDGNGAFIVPSPIDRKSLSIIASNGDGWEHISVSRKTRCPKWAEMDHVKRLFFKPNEVVMQLHVADSDHISIHEYCLHLWRPLNCAIPLPPSYHVGPKINLHG